MRTVLIGKGRRVTLEELDVISRCAPGSVSTKDAAAMLELLAATDAPMATEESVKSKDDDAWLEERLASMQISGEAAEDSFFTEVESRAALTLLANFCAQHRNGIPFAHGIMNLLNRKGHSPMSRIRMSRTVSTFMEQFKTFMSWTSMKQQQQQQEQGGDFFYNVIYAASERILPLAVISMATLQILKLVKNSTMDGLASLSVEHVAALMASASAAAAATTSREQDLSTPSAPSTSPTSPQELIQMFADTHYDLNRPHRGMMNSASVLRVCVQGSKLGATLGTTMIMDSSLEQPDHLLSQDRIHAIQTIPAYHGPSTDAVISAVKVLELECNCFESQSIPTLDTTILHLTCDTVHNAAQILIQNTLFRMGRRNQNNTTIHPSANTDSCKDIHSKAKQLSNLVEQLYSILTEEAKMNIQFMEEEIAKASDIAKKKAEEKAARAAFQMAASVQTNVEEKDEFEGMTDAQKQKILKKRAEKEAKAAKKKASKVQADGSDVSIFGSGSIHIMNILREHDVCLSEPCVISALDEVIGKLLSGGVQRKPKIAKGTRDYLPEQMMIRDQAFQIIRRVFKSHGAVEIDTPVFELKDTLTGKYGEDSKLIYDLADQGGELLALRYDLTVPFARFLALNNVGNIKRFHIGKVYRRDQPQLSKGRYREFYQCDFDIAGTYGRMVPDSECLCVATEILSSLPIGDFGIKLNHRRLLDAILDLCGVPSDKFRTICSAVDKLDKEPWEAVKKEMVDDKGLKEDVADKIGVFVVQKGEPWQMYHSLMTNAVFGNHKGALEALEDLRILFSYLEAMGKLKYFSFDLSLARGLDYYTGVIYEAVCMNGNTQVGSIGGGGRYDNLVSMFQEAGKVTPCVGVSVGIERVFTLMEERLRQENGGSIKQPNVSVLVAQAGENMMLERMRVSKLLWDSNISAEFNQQENPKLKYEIANALDRSIPFMVVIGEDEAKENKCRVKDLNARTEEIVHQSQLVSTLRAKGVIPVGCEFAAELLKSQTSA